MGIQKVWAFYFSPNGRTKKVVKQIALELSVQLQCSLVEIDYTQVKARKERYSFETSDLVVMGTPVYAGRVPNKLLEFLNDKFKGDGATAVCVSVFGNRSYEDALFELSKIMENNNFNVLAGAGIVAQHAFSSLLGTQRPNEKDLSEMAIFARQIAEDILGSEERLPPLELKALNDPLVYYTPKGIDGETTIFLKARPQTNEERCNACLWCVSHCPMNAFESGNPLEVTGTCIKCHACINGCPQKAKAFTDAAFISHKAMLEANYRACAQNEYFIAKKED